jgi:FkbM family methyltransferase
MVDNAQRGVKTIFRKCFRSVGYDVVEFPMSNDVALREHLMRVFDHLGINCVLDVGAHFGEFGEFLRHSGYRGRIVSFEPVAESYALLEECRAKYRDWEALNIALGAEDGVLPFHVTRSTNFSSFLVPNEYCSAAFGSSGAIQRTQEVPVRRLEAVYARCIEGIRAPRVFLKMDTQGYDLEVLRGAAQSIESIQALQSEVTVKPIYDGMTGYQEAISQISKLGFELSGLFPVSHDHLLRVVELNCVMVRTPA